jgi:hypothetical protein
MRMEIRYPPELLPDEQPREWDARLRAWRMDEKGCLLGERGWNCQRCGGRAEQLDEGIVTRGDMRGLSLKQRRLAFASCNLFLLCADCNVNHAHDREGAWARACARYGEDAVREWYGSLGLRAPRGEWLP